jgi:flagellar M-ring protein FliF
MNQNLSQLGRQLLAIWKQLGINQRISIALTGLAVLGGLLGLAYWSSRENFTLLYGRLDETEAARVIAALEETKTPYQARGGGSILVPADKVHQVRMELAGKGIPRGEGVGFEIFDKPNFGISDFVQRANYMRAIQGELARTISQLDHVEAARVMIVLPENRLLLGNQQKPTASVFVRVRGSAELPTSAVNSIRLLVANAVEGLQVTSVSVVDNQGNVLSDNQEDSVAGLTSNQLVARRNLEQYLARKAEGMLEQVLGRGQAVVRVSTDINWDTTTRFEERFDPEGQVIRHSTIDDENTDSGTPISGGPPGVAANTMFDTNTVSAGTSGVSATRTKRKTTNNQYEINRTVSNLMQSAGGLERISAAVFIAQRFEGSGADRKAVPRSPEELQKLRRIVQSALGIVENDASRTDEITLEEMPFNDQPVVELTRQLDQQQTRDYWIELAQRLVLPVIGFTAILLFWRSLKRTRPEDITIGLPVDSAAAPSRASTNGAPARRTDPPGVVTVEVLNQLIRENPASLTQAVRSWMNQDKPAR